MARKADFTLQLFEPGDEVSVGNVLTLAYDSNSRAQLVMALRKRGDLAVELLAMREGSVIGYIGFSRLEAPRDWFALATLGVLPQYRDSGVGADLVRYGLDYTRRAGADAIAVVGDGRFYQRFGFTYKAAQNLTTPFQFDNTLLYPIAAGTAFADARLVYPEPYLQMV